MEETANLIIGFIRGKHGLTGKVKVESTSGETEHFFSLKEVTLRKDGVDRVGNIESVEGGSSFLVLKFTGIDTPEQADMLRGVEIVVPRDKACPLNKGEFYVEDLKNCSLIYNVSEGLKTEPEWITTGIITDVLEGGASDLLEVALSESLHSAINGTDKDGKQRIVLVPFIKEFIGTVDLKRKTVQLMYLWILE